MAGVLSHPLRPAALRALLPPQEPPAMAAASPPDPKGARSIGKDDIEAALDGDQFTVEFQPKVDCATRELCGFEALARWRLPSGDSISPAVFIPLVENAGLIDALTDRVMRLGLSMLADHFAHTATGLSVNVSSFGVIDDDFADRAAGLCESHGVEADRITFEFTESGIPTDSALELDMFTRIRMQGFHLSIDDFGTGYSSMTRLMELPFSEIKIDRSFVASLTTSTKAWGAVRSITSLAKDLKLIVVAEGVEDEPTLECLAEIGCDQVQGYLTGMPMEPAALTGWIEGQRQGASVRQTP